MTIESIKEILKSVFHTNLLKQNGADILFEICILVHITSSCKYIQYIVSHGYVYT
jgi:hypothetical protein